MGTLGNDLRVEFKAVGDTVNLASRMEGLAEPGSTYVTKDTFKLTAGLFSFEALGEKAVKGKEKPVSVYKLVSAKKDVHRPRLGLERSIYSEVVGRDQELSRIQLQVVKAINGEGSIVNVIGEAGIGKSRLIAELHHRHGRRPHARRHRDPAGGRHGRGVIQSLDDDLAALAILLIPVFMVLFLGFGVAAIVAGLLVAAFGARQVREVEALIKQKPGHVLVAGLAESILRPLAAILLMVTIIGAPVGLGLLLVVLPALAFLGWIVAAIWLGDWLVGRMRGSREPARPYLAAVLGIIVLAIAGLLPFVTTIATLFGFGGLLLAAWRVHRPEAPPAAPVGLAQPMPSAG